MWAEFKKFISRGNVLDLAVAVILGAAFSAIINSLVADVIMPIVGVFLGGLNFTALAITVGESQILYGNFIQAILNFLVIAASMFLVVKGANSMLKKQEAVPPPPPQPTVEEKLLTQIRDLLQEQAKR